MLFISSVSDNDSISIFIVPYGKEGLQYSSQHTVELRNEKTEIVAVHQGYDKKHFCFDPV